MNPVRLLRAWRAWSRVTRLWEGYVRANPKAEPVMFAELVKAAAVLLALFGLELTAEQVAAIVVLGGPLVAWYVRSRVSPVKE